MGEPKSLLTYQGLPLIVYIYKRLSPLFGEALISVSGEERIPPELAPAKVVVDRYAGKGPIAGIASCLAASRHETVFVTACDIPTVYPDLIAEMIDLSDSYDVVVPRTIEGFIEPLHAVYKRGVLPKLLKLIDSGERRIRMLYDAVNTCYLDLPADQFLTNINTPEEYKSILG